MAICSKHGQYYPDGTHCGTCWNEQMKANKQAAKSQFVKSKFKQIPKDEKTKTRDKLKAKLQALHSKNMKELYKEMGFYYC